MRNAEQPYLFYQSPPFTLGGDIFKEDMTITSKNNALIAEKRWKEFLLTLPEGMDEFDIVFDDLNSLKSFKSVAYQINSDGVGEKAYSLKEDKPSLICSVVVKRRSAA